MLHHRHVTTRTVTLSVLLSRGRSTLLRRVCGFHLFVGLVLPEREPIINQALVELQVTHLRRKRIEDVCRRSGTQ